MFSYSRIILFIVLLLTIGCGDIEDTQPIETIPYFEEPIDLAPSAPSRVEENYVKVQAYYVEPRNQSDPPTEREYNRDVRKIRNLLSRSQRFFREQMEAHGHGRKTFELVKENGRIKVNRLTLKYDESLYISGARDPLYEIYAVMRRNESQQRINVFFMISNIPETCGFGDYEHIHKSGFAYLDGNCWNWQAVSHELGHAFGLHHDFRLGRRSNRMMAYGRNRDRLSEGAALWLNEHSAFNRSEFHEKIYAFPERTIRRNPLKIEIVSYNDGQFNEDLNYTVAQLLDRDGTYPEVIDFTKSIRIWREGRRNIIFTLRFDRADEMPRRIQIKIISRNDPMIRSVVFRP